MQTSSSGTAKQGREGESAEVWLTPRQARAGLASTNGNDAQNDDDHADYDDDNAAADNEDEDNDDDDGDGGDADDDDQDEDDENDTDEAEQDQVSCVLLCDVSRSHTLDAENKTTMAGGGRDAEDGEVQKLTAEKAPMYVLAWVGIRVGAHKHKYCGLSAERATQTAPRRQGLGGSGTDLHMPFAICGTDIAFGASRQLRSRQPLRLAPLFAYLICLCPSYEIPGTDDGRATASALAMSGGSFGKVTFEGRTMRRGSSVEADKGSSEGEDAFGDKLKRMWSEDVQRLVCSRPAVLQIPENVQERIRGGDKAVMDRFESVVVMICEVVDMRRYVERMNPADYTEMLNGIFDAFDLVAQHEMTTRIVDDSVCRCQMLFRAWCFRSNAVRVRQGRETSCSVSDGIVCRSYMIVIGDGQPSNDAESVSAAMRSDSFAPHLHVCEVSTLKRGWSEQHRACALHWYRRSSVSAALHSTLHIFHSREGDMEVGGLLDRGWG
eukprot:518745-Rhodomonas_salina.13